LIGIERIGVYIPETKEDNYEKRSTFNIDQNFIDDKVGVRYTAKKSDQEETSDLCIRAYSDLKKKVPVESEEIGLIVVVTQNPDNNGLPHTSAIVHDRLNLPEKCAAFDISLGCSGYVYGLSTVISFMKENEIEKGLLFTADPYSKIIDCKDKNTSLLFGDAATVTLLSSDPVWKLGKSDFGTYGKGADALCVKDGKLFMDGRKIFNFSATTVVKSIKNTLAKNNLTVDQVETFLLHQASKYLVDMIAFRIGVDKVPFFAKDYGNTISSSIPIGLNSVFFHSKHQNILLSGFGVGLSWATTIITRRKF